MKRLLHRIRGRIRADWARASEVLALKSALMVRVARLGLVKLKFPLRKEFLVLQCSDGNDASGLFSEFAAVLGMLAHYEKWNAIYAGVNVDFGTQGLYYDPSVGANWWQYYFEPIELGCSRNARIRMVSAEQHDELALRIDRMPRRLGAELIRRHVRVRARVTEKVDAYAREHFQGTHVIGIHYRGTDKNSDLPLVPYETVWAAVRAAIEAGNGRPYRIFVATDEQAFLNDMRRRVPAGLLYRESVRSTDGSPTHKKTGNNYAKGEDALVDCLLLARSDRLIRTASNLSLCAALFNPDLPQIVLSTER